MTNVRMPKSWIVKNSTRRARNADKGNRHFENMIGIHVATFQTFIQGAPQGVRELEQVISVSSILCLMDMYRKA